MEYCERHTLRDLIRKGLDETPDDGWRLFRQMLEGLAHIHQHGIIHRDLKPDNIFIDSSGNPRIGDLGLATTGKFQLPDRAATGSTADGDMTRSVGTTFYVAPELSSQTRGDYTQKVDMYSLGIIFFEMCFPLKTAMERDRTIRSIRQKDHTLPEAFKTPDKQLQGSIILSLISHRPSERPSSAELLRSGKIPVKIEDNIIRHAIEGLSDQNSPYYHQMMTALFSQTPTRQVKDYTWDMGPAASAMQNITATLLALKKVVQERLGTIFSRHGAVPTNRQQLFPSSVHYANSNAVQLIDASGTLVQLPYDLTLPYARALARFLAPADKTYTFGEVFRRSTAGGAPRSFGEADFDIMSTDALDLALKEAEAIKVLDEIIDEFPCFVGSQMCFHLNHSQLLDVILDFCRINKPQRPAVKEVLSKLNTHHGSNHWDWQKIRSELRAPSLDIPSTSLDDIARFDFRDPPEKAIARIKAIIETSTGNHLDRTHAVFSHIRTVAAYLKQFSVRRKIYLSPLSCFNEKFYAGGILFQCLFDTKRKEVLAAGGRYDRLIEEYRPKVPGTQSASHAVGFNLGWDRIVSSMHQFLKGQGKSATFLRRTSSTAAQNVGPWTPRRCDVLVASFDSEVLRTTGVKMVAELWANDISAELSVDTRSPEELLSHYRNDNHCWTVIIKHDSTTVTSGKADLKIKNLITKQDADIKSENLISHIRAELRDREHRDGVAERSKMLQRLPSVQEGASSDQRRNEVQVLIAQHRSKKSSKWGIVEAAQTRAQTLLSEYSSAPIAAIETRDEVMDVIRGTRLGDPESWRRAIQTVPVGDRQYLQQVQGLLEQFRREWEEKDVESEERPRVAMVYNFRTGAMLLYDLGL
jgi:translation initiation factor 2-alpha kinase 4